MGTLTHEAEASWANVLPIDLRHVDEVRYGYEEGIEAAKCW